MFTPNRFVIVDDEEAHLIAIRKTLEHLGSSCVAIRFVPGDPMPSEPFKRARVIFMDLQLLDRQGSTDYKRHYGAIQGILQTTIPVDGGPFVMVVWTDKPELVSELEAYLGDHLYDKHPHARPIKVLAMSKTEFIDIDTGEAKNPQALLEHVRTQLATEPALAALLQWETDIIEASDRVVHDIMGFATAAGESPDLPIALKRMATEAVGAPNVERDPQGAVHSALLPLLQDHVQYEVVGDPEHPDLWDKTFSEAPASIPELNREQAADLNTQIHLGKISPTLKPTTWGAICELEEKLNWRREFGLASAEDYRVHAGKRVMNGPGGSPPDPEKMRLVQIRIGAACDYAQKTDGPIPFVLACFIPVYEFPKPDPNAKKASKPKPLGVLKLDPRATAWLSPVLRLPNWGLGHLLVDPRFVRIRGSGFAKNYVRVARLREQLLMELIAVVSQHSSRPGITAFYGTDEA